MEELNRKPALINTPYYRIRQGGVSLDIKDIVDRANYRTLESQVDLLMRSGRQLAAYRAGLYDFTEDQSVPDDYNDPTRDAGFDLVDAHALARGIAGRMREPATEEPDRTQSESESETEKPAEEK